MRKELKKQVNHRVMPRLVLRTAARIQVYAGIKNASKYMELSGLNTAVYGNFFGAYSKFIYAERQYLQ